MPHPRVRRVAVAATALALAISLVSPPHSARAGISLSDIAGHWAAKDIAAAVDAGWVNGYPDGTFRPEAPVTRAEFVTLLARTEGLKVTTPADPRLAYLAGRLAEQGHWLVHNGYAQAAVAAHVLEPADYTMSYTAAGQVNTWALSPDTPLTRTEAAVMLSRALGLQYEAEAPLYYPGSQYAAKVNPPFIGFTDASSMPSWSVGWIGAVAGRGIIKGYPDDGGFHGERVIKRAEAVSLMRRIATQKITTASLLTQIQTSRFDLTGDLPALADRRFKPWAHLKLDNLDSVDATTLAAAWVRLPLADKQAALKTQAQALWDQTKAKDLTPLQLSGVEVILWGKPGQLLAQGTFDGTQLTYWESSVANPASNPNLEASLLGHLVVDNMSYSLEDEIQNARQMATDMQGALDHVERRAQYSFPYQYLGDWFTLPSGAGQAWVLQKAQAYWNLIRPQVEQNGGKLETVRISVAPSDTADTLGTLRSLRVGDSFLANPVAEYTFDGQTLTEVSRAASLGEWLAVLHPVYELRGGGDGAPAEEVQDPAPAAARQRLETLVYTLGRSK